MLLPIVYFILLADDIAIHFLWQMLSPPNANESMLYMASVIAIYVW